MGRGEERREMVLSQKLHEAFKGTVERITGPRTVSAFKGKGVLSVTEFLLAGDNLVSKCPTWSWESGEPSKRKPYFLFKVARLGMARVQLMGSGYASLAGPPTANPDPCQKLQDRNSQALSRHPRQDDGGTQKHLSENYVSKKERFKFLVSTLRDLKESKEEVYGALDACVAWEQSFPIGSLKTALFVLQKEQHWHRVIQVIKWMLSKGQGNTYGTYKQLIQALDMDNRAEEAHMFWLKKIGTNLHSVPWSLCQCIMSVYYRHNMPKNLVKFFEGLEGYDRVAPDKSIVQQVADAYEMLGSLDEKTKVLEKYNYLFTGSGCHKKHKTGSLKKRKKSGRREPSATFDGLANAVSHS